MALLTCSLFTGQSNAQSQSTTNPDFSNVNDILYGNRTLFSIQDLQIVSVQPDPLDNKGANAVTAFPVTTSNSNPTNAPSQWVSPAGSDQPKVFSGRMFNKPSATVVVALNGNVPSEFYRTDLAVVSPQSVQGPVVNVHPQGGVPNGVMADFDGDGYDDLALSYNDGFMVIASP